MLEVSDDGLRRWTGKEWESAGSHSGSDTDRRRLLKARSYIPLSNRGARAVFLDAELGDLLGLTKSEKGYDLRPLTTAKGSAPAGYSTRSQITTVICLLRRLQNSSDSTLKAVNDRSFRLQMRPRNSRPSFAIAQEESGQQGSCCTCRSMKGNIGLSFGCQC